MSPLNVGSLATSIFDLVLDLGATALTSLSANNICNTLSTLSTVLFVVIFDLYCVDSYCSK